MRDISTLIAVMVGCIILSQFKYMAVPHEPADGSFDYRPYIDELPEDIIFGLGCVQAITALLLLVGFCVNKINLIVKAGWRQRVNKNQVEMVMEQKQLQ
jgi:hypothetical protein